MAYDPRVVAAFNKAIAHTGAPPVVAKALFEAGIVESGLRNLNYGDRDSVGSLQQRPSQGWNHALQPYAAALDFLNKAMPLAKSGLSSGDIAQAVQRSAYPERYAKQGKAASGLIGGSSASGSSPAAPEPTVTGAAGPLVSSVAPALGDPGQAGDFSSLVSSLLNQKAQPSAPSISALPAPSFAASPSLPQAYTQLQPVGAPAPPAQDRAQAGLSLVGALGGTAATAGSSGSLAGPQTAPSASTAASASAAPAKTLKVKPGSPVADLTSEGGLHPTEGLNGFPAHDYFAPSGSAAVAPVTGKVVKLSGHDPSMGPVAGPHGPLGWSVYIKAPDGKTYYLTHMGSRNVKVGQTVRAGQQIGTVANYAKYGTPSHIHMGVNG